MELKYAAFWTIMQGGGYEIVPYKSIEKDSVVIIASIAYPQIKRQLKDIGVNKVCYYEILPFLKNGFKTYYMGFEELWQTVIFQREALKKCILMLGDDISKQVMDNILCYRLSLEDKYLEYAYEISNEYGVQYFDQCISLSDEEVFADCGGYTGDTATEFIKQCNEKYKEIYLFEPDESLIYEAKENLKKYSNIYFINKGIDQKNFTRNFSKNESKGGGSINIYGGEMIETISLDWYFKQKKNVPTYIKMDIEGFEMNALLGAKHIISEKRPKLAVSIYHRPQDIFKIPLFLKEFGLNYKFYMRHYTRMYADTVLYCIPMH